MAYRYKTVKIDGKTKLLHRHIMEELLGRLLVPGEIVHHKNGDKYDNDPGNLEVLSAKEHSKHHNQKYPLTKSCLLCGLIFTPLPTKRKRAKTCSSDCRFKLMSMTRRGVCPEPVKQIINAVRAAA